MFKVINGNLENNKKKREQKEIKLNNLYKENMIKAIIMDDIYKASFFGVKYISTLKIKYMEDLDKLEYAINLSEYINSLLSKLTVKEFTTIFPINKFYQGEKWSSKDYFYVMNYLKDFDWDEPIGFEVNELLWEYDNKEIMKYLINTLLFIDTWGRITKGFGIIDEFIEKNNITTYSINKKENYILNKKTGKTEPLKEIKGNKKNFIVYQGKK